MDSFDERCLHLRRNSKCDLLTCPQCPYEPCCKRCPFYLTEYEYMKRRLKAYARLRTLPDYEQDYIAMKYYKGQKPWMAIEVTT